MTSLLTVGNDVKGYRMAGIPDGLGAYDNGDGTITLLVNHELAAGRGKVRGHGGTGAFVSRWVIDTSSLAVVSGADLVTSPEKLLVFSDGAWKPGSGKSIDLSRFCSADLAPISTNYNAATQKGYNGHLFLTGEEAGSLNQNRAFAFVPAEGSGYQLPAFGFGVVNDKVNPPPSWETLVANPDTSDATVVMAMSDGGTSQVYVYAGTKMGSGSPVEKAGLTNGKIFALRVDGRAAEDRDSGLGIGKSLVGKGAGVKFALAEPNKGTSFLRPEDGAWDPRNRNVFYFVSTDRNNFVADGTVGPNQDVTQVGRSRLWAITFDDAAAVVTNGAAAGKIEMLLDGTEGGDMFDNICIDKTGVIYLCEDSGNSRHNGKIWSYDTASGAFSTIMRFDPAKFGDINDKKYTPPIEPFVDDKETSGIIDVTNLFQNAIWFKPGSRVLLAVVQAHFKYDLNDSIGGDLVEGGQLLLLTKAG